MVDSARSRTREWWVHSSAGLFFGVAVCVGLFVGDAVTKTNLVLIPLLVVGPLVVSGSVSPRATAGVGLMALTFAVALGWINDIELTRRHVVGVSTVGLGGVLAVWLAAVRSARERELRQIGPERERTARLSFALHTGKVGSWSWDVATGEVVWDRELEALFGVAPGQFSGTFEDWVSRLDPRDRERVIATVQEMVNTKTSVRFDHRCVWPDGSVHWLEGVGDVLVRGGRVVSGFGLSIDIDERVRQIDERNRLLEMERSARERSEYLIGVNAAIGETLATDEIMARVTASAVPGLADWCAVLVSIDRPRAKPLLVYSHADPAEMEKADQFLGSHPFDPDAPFGAAAVIRTGHTEFIRDIDPALFTGDAAILTPFGIRSAVTVPLKGALGTLGSLQLIRTGDRVFDEGEVALAEELARRVGSALNNAVLFARQSRIRAALETQQRLDARLNVASTRSEIRDIIIELDWVTAEIQKAVLYLYDERGELTSADSSSSEPADEARFASLIAMGRARRPGELVLPIVMMRSNLGLLVLEFAAERELSIEELSTFETIANRCGGALERARLYEEARDAALMLQRRLMPTLPVPPSWLEVAAIYQPTPGGEVGGDWFQLLEAPGGRIVAVVGDAVGHGLGAAAAMGQLRGAIAGAVAGDPDPDRVLAATERFAATADDTLFATVACILLDAGPVVRYACAGHLPPAWVRPGEPPRLLDGGRRPLLGAGQPDAMSVAVSAEFAAGDTIVVYTDGLVERRGEPLDLGVARLLVALGALAKESVDDVCRGLIDELTPGRDIEDDIALLVLRRV